MTVAAALTADTAESQVASQEQPRSYAPEVIADASGKWCGNALRFPTFEEADGNVRDLYARWTLVRDFRVVPSTDEPNHRWQEGKLISLS